MLKESYVSLPDHPGCKVRVEPSDHSVRVIYLGTPEHLLAAGAISADMLERRPVGSNTSRNDADGDGYLVEWSWGSVGGQPVQRVRVIREKSRARALALPSVAEALSVAARTEPETTKRPGAMYPPLRLVWSAPDA